MTMSRLEAVLAEVGQQAERSMQQLDRAEQFAERSGQLRVTGASPDRLVRVTVDGTGQMVGVELDERSMAGQPAELEAGIMSALGAAQRQLTFRIQELGEEIYGEGSATVAMFTEQYRQRYGYEEA